MAALVAGAVLGTGAHVLAGPQGPDPDMAQAVVLAATADRKTPPAVDPTELRALVESAVLRADVEACGKLRQGTVTMVRAPAGTVGLTNAHVVRGATTVRLSGGGLGVSEVSVGDYLAARDIAVVDVAPLAAPSDAPLELGGEVAPGDEVTAVGFPGGTWSVQGGRVVATERRAGWGGTGEMMVIDVPAVDGTSGGVVVDPAGRAVGLIAARDPSSGHSVAYPMRDVLTRAVGPEIGC